MKALVLSPAAEIDLANIWDYSAATWGPDQADRYTDEIEEIAQLLATGQKRGRPVDVRKGYLKYAAGSHMLYFRDQGQTIEIIRILHQHQDVSLNLPG